MLSTPMHGWSTLALGGQDYPVSYLTDVPVDWASSIAHGIRENVPVSLYADMEGSELYITLFHGFAAVMVDDDGLTAVRLDMGWKDFCLDLLADLKRDFDAWAAWNPDAEFEKDLDRRRTALRMAIQDLESAIPLLR